ncbi:ThuA domain-containing protein [Catenovulum adriaticum]|uniref:ThuA domain-containing protein n=1 Tax=Catenovulum adriaticum TaxID=2984846 RepID=A0ABY7ASL3_9ALTE|nr:ThuA domain-containing protein [Catenovulum sp. TS8]WAJ71757.1 ThuA domain-containing protein [Catenovulum sp. TS8]
MKNYLEQTGLFEVDIYRSKYTWKANVAGKQFALNDGKKYQDLPEPKTDPEFSPNFTEYDVVISNFGWKAADWSISTQQALVSYMKNGGGLVVVHAANNSFPQWLEYNKMTALGGWGGRSEKDGPYVYFNKQGKLIRDRKKGGAGSHGPRHRFTIKHRDLTHPITQGLPEQWLHTEDELYAKLRGPAENMQVLASAFSARDKKGTDRHEPVLMVINYAKGRVFHTTLGHDVQAMSGKGFKTTFTRGSEWAATGQVTQSPPESLIEKP